MLHNVAQLLKHNQPLLHTQDVALLWGITNTNTLHTTIKRYVQKGVLHPIQKGLYSTLPYDRLDPLQLGAKLIHRYAYVSTETVLAQHGIIAQLPQQVTFISDISQTITWSTLIFRVRKLAPQFLYNPAGITQQSDGVLVASVHRAIADMRYFQPSYHFDSTHFIDEKTVQTLQKEIGYTSLSDPVLTGTD